MSPSDIDVNGSIQTHLIVTPARNEAESLQWLGECRRADLASDTWIVLDNPSTDCTDDVVRK